MSIGYILYKISTRSYFKIIQLIAPINERAGILFRGQQMPINIEKKQNNELRLWLHVASLGEFEQAKPVLVELKKNIPQLKIIATFFSPSGYENRKNDVTIDAAFYLPFENKKNVDSVLNVLNPDLVIWVKYDFWIDYLNAIHQKKIPLYLIAAQFRANQIYFKFPGNFHLDLFKKFTQIFTQNQASSNLLKQFGIESTYTGDPRYDNVFSLKNQKKELPLLDSFYTDLPVVICGSTYLVEEKIIAEFKTHSKKEYKFIIAPHFIDSKHIETIQSLFPDAIKYSEIKENQSLEKTQTVIIDNIGILAHLYQKANIAIVGGGFKQGGLHNILEAAVCEIPVLFGPKTEEFPEANELINYKIAFTFNNSNELQEHLDSLNPSRIVEIKLNATQFIQAHLGASKNISKSILNKLKA